MTSSSPDIEIRRLRFNLPKEGPRYWNDNCPVKTHLLNAVAILAPAFERLAISSVIPFKDHIPNPKLKQEVANFIGQESAHGSEFIRYNQALKLQGYDTKNLEKANLKQFKWLSKKLSPMMHLSLTLAAEHLTAIISDQLLREPEWLEQAQPAYQALWRWHAMEEIEHKSVVFDLYQSIHGSYIARVTGMWLTSWMLCGLLLRNFFHLVRKDKLLFSFSFWGRCFNYLFFKPGLIKNIFVSYWHYYVINFHPWQQPNQDMLMQWRAYFESSRGLYS